MTMRPPPETDFFLQWGNRKRLRCVRIRSSNTSPPHLSSSSPDLSSSNSTRIRRKITSRFLSVTSNDEKHLSFPQPSSSRLTRYYSPPFHFILANLAKVFFFFFFLYVFVWEGLVLLSLLLSCVCFGGLVAVNLRLLKRSRNNQVIIGFMEVFSFSVSWEKSK